MKTHTIHVERVLRAPQQTVWALLDDVTTWSVWGQFDAAALEAPGDAHGRGAVRVFRTGRRTIRTLGRVQSGLLKPPAAELSARRDWRADVIDKPYATVWTRARAQTVKCGLDRSPTCRSTVRGMDCAGDGLTGGGSWSGSPHPSVVAKCWNCALLRAAMDHCMTYRSL